jgi:hypothetical protein
MFISDKFKFSNNKFIKILQKLVCFATNIALFGLIGYLLDVSIPTSIFCEGDEESGVRSCEETQISPTRSSETEVQISQDKLKKEKL